MLRRLAAVSGIGPGLARAGPHQQRAGSGLGDRTSEHAPARRAVAPRCRRHRSVGVFPSGCCLPLPFCSRGVWIRPQLEMVALMPGMVGRRVCERRVGVVVYTSRETGRIYVLKITTVVGEEGYQERSSFRLKLIFSSAGLSSCFCAPTQCLGLTKRWCAQTSTTSRRRSRHCVSSKATACRPGPEPKHDRRVQALCESHSCSDPTARVIGS
eukprot:3435138-Rhodomonas_salina.1